MLHEITYDFENSRLLNIYIRFKTTYTLPVLILLNNLVHFPEEFARLLYINIAIPIICHRVR